MGVARTPIIGWRVRPNGLDAITPEDHDVSTVKYPDGQVAVLGDQTYANEAEWLAAMEDEILAAEQKARDGLPNRRRNFPPTFAMSPKSIVFGGTRGANTLGSDGSMRGEERAPLRRTSGNRSRDNGDSDGA